MARRLGSRYTRVLAALSLSCFACTAPHTGPVRITVDPSVRFQTMTGWEATAQAGQDHPQFSLWRDSLVALAVNDLGINRLRLEVRSGSEHTRDYFADGRANRLGGRDYRCARYETVNDNDDPRVIDWAGFHFTELDETIERLVLPVQRAVAARGEQLVVNLTYVSFFRQCPRGRRYDHRSADEYAEFVLATLLHMREKYRLVPALWEIVLEPDNTDDWSGTSIGQAIVATDVRLREHGFDLKFVAPSNTSMAAALRYHDAVVAVPGARQRLAELAYHRYRGVSTETLQRIAEHAARDSVQTAMLEHIGADIDELLDDLTIGNVSAWSEYALAFDARGPDDGGLYYRVDTQDPAHPVIREGARTRFLRQLFAGARLGAVRIGAVSDAPAARPVAFRNLDGRLALVVRTTGPTPLSVTGLAPGRYTITFASDTTAAGSLPDIDVATGQLLQVTMPAAGVIAIRTR